MLSANDKRAIKSLLYNQFKRNGELESGHAMDLAQLQICNSDAFDALIEALVTGASLALMPHNESPDLTCAAIATIAKRHHVATSRDTLQECLRNLITEDGEYVVGLGGQKAIEKTRAEVLRDAAVFVENVEVSLLGWAVFRALAIWR